MSHSGVADSIPKQKVSKYTTSMKKTLAERRLLLLAGLCNVHSYMYKGWITEPIKTEPEPGTGAPVSSAAVAAAAVEKGPGDLSNMDFHSMTYMAL